MSIGGDRRRGNNLQRLAVHWLAGPGWPALFGPLVFLDQAPPRPETLLNRPYHTAPRPAWDPEPARCLLYPMILGLVLNLVG